MGGGQVRVRLRVRRLDGGFGFRCYLYGQGEGGATSGSAVVATFAVEIRRGLRFTKDCLNVCPSWGEEGGGRRGEEVRLRVRRGMRLRGDVGVGGSGSGSGVTAVEQSLSAHVLDLL